MLCLGTGSVQTAKGAPSTLTGLAAISPSPGENEKVEDFLTSSIRKKERKLFRSLSKGVLSAQEGFPAARNRVVLNGKGSRMTQA